jgi:hypothetical protein
MKSSPGLVRVARIFASPRFGACSAIPMAMCGSCVFLRVVAAAVAHDRVLVAIVVDDGTETLEEWPVETRRSREGTVVEIVSLR